MESGLMRAPDMGLRGGRRDSTAAEKRYDYKNSIHENPLHSLVIYSFILSYVIAIPIFLFLLSFIGLKHENQYNIE